MERNELESLIRGFYLNDVKEEFPNLKFIPLIEDGVFKEEAKNEDGVFVEIQGNIIIRVISN